MISRVGNLLFCSSLICSSIICSFAQIAEEKWANCSGCSWQMSECQWLAQVAQHKRANEWIARFFEWIAHFSLPITKNEQFAQKNVLYSFLEVFKKQKIHPFLSRFFKVADAPPPSVHICIYVNCTFAFILHRINGKKKDSPIPTERCERIAQVPHQKWENEWIAHFFKGIAHLLTFLAKTSDLLRNLMNEFPTLMITPVPVVYVFYPFKIVIELGVCCWRIVFTELCKVCGDSH